MLRNQLSIAAVPEVYGGKVEEGCVFIYMELVQGKPLHAQWDNLSDQDRSSSCAQLNEIVSQHSSKSSKTLQIHLLSLVDLCLTMPLRPCHQQAHSRASKKFNDWFSALPQRQLPDSLKYQDPDRTLLPDNEIIKFTHGDSHRGTVHIRSLWESGAMFGYPNS
ncbi:hypothetical protein VTO42DRAFT_3860 [Malbranchea cinnamomea]